LTVREAAELLGLRPRTVREYLHRGELSGRLIRKRWRFRRNDLAEFLARPPEWELR
jgi:excisionase family DNA binding protein